MSIGTSESKAAGGGGFYFDEMELTLGLPGDSRGRISGMKRSFSDMVDLKLGSSENPEIDESGSECSGSESKKATSMDSRERLSGTKRTYSDMVDLKLGSTENPEIDESDSECSRSESRKPTSTERVIGLPGDSRERMSGTKQLYSDVTDLKLGSSENPAIDESDSECSGSESRKPTLTDQVIGWPPLRSYRKNTTNNNCKYVKVAVDGAPYLRKVDLKSCTSYQQLLHVFENMFTCFKINNVLDEKKVNDHVNRSEHVPTYEDKDGDWMLVGDVPWKMFVESCKRIRLMKSTEAIMQLGVYNTMK